MRLTAAILVVFLSACGEEAHLVIHDNGVCTGRIDRPMFSDPASRITFRQEVTASGGQRCVIEREKRQ